MFCSYTPIVHLQIDVQDRFLKLLAVPLRVQYASLAQQRVEDLRSLGIPTIHAAFRRRWILPDDIETPPWANWKIFSTRLTHRVKDIHVFGGAVKDSLGLATPISESDLVYVKSDNSVFYRKKLATFLRQKRCHTLLISGLNTHACVIDTANSSVQCGFRTFVMADVLADVYKLPHARFIGSAEEQMYLFNRYAKREGVQKVVLIDGKKLVEHTQKGENLDRYLDDQMNAESQRTGFPLYSRYPFNKGAQSSGAVRANWKVSLCSKCRGDIRPVLSFCGV